MANVLVKVNTDKASEKYAELAAGITTIAANGSRDGGTHLLGRTVGEVINGTHVNRVTGMLVRSYTEGSHYDASSGQFIIRANTGIAPYAPHVLAWSAKKYGRDFLEITSFFYGHEVVEGITREVERMARTVTAGGHYQYRNPFPA